MDHGYRELEGSRGNGSALEDALEFVLLPFETNPITVAMFVLVKGPKGGVPEGSNPVEGAQEIKCVHQDVLLPISARQRRRWYLCIVMRGDISDSVSLSLGRNREEVVGARLAP